MNKRAEKIYIFWWFMACLLVFVVIILMAVGFFTKPIDVRDIQAKAIYVRAFNCFSEGGYFIQEDGILVFNKIGDCGFVAEVMKDSSAVISVNVWSEDSKILYFGALGATNLKGDCDVSGGRVVAKNFPYCYTRNESVYYYENGERKNGFLEILAASNYYGTRVSVIPAIKLPKAVGGNDVK